MRRFLVSLVVVLLFAGATGVATPAPPAAAHTDVCTGFGVMSTSTDLLWQGLGVALADFLFNHTSLFVCFEKLVLYMRGTVHGYCDLSVGSGTTHTGHNFSWINTGGHHVLFLDLTGTMEVTADMFANESCLTGADRFHVYLNVALVHGV